MLRRKPGKKLENAQGMVEFALVLPMLLLLMFGIIELGRLLFVYSATFTASREAARHGSASGTAGSVVRYQDCDGMKAAAMRLGNLAGIQDSDITIAYDHGTEASTFDTNCPAVTDTSSGFIPVCNDPVCLGDRVRVTVVTRYQPFVPLVRLPAFNITSTTARTVLKDVVIKVSAASP